MFDVIAVFYVKLCPRCKTRERAPHRGYCKECRREYERERRKSLSEEQRKKANCRSYTNVLIQRGELTRGPCEECGTTENVEAHHENYDDPRTVRWLCVDHHGGLHAERRNGICPKCNERPRAHGDAYCTDCRREYHRKWQRKNRPSYSELSEEQKQKARCRSYTRVLVRRGKLIPTPCACGSEDVEAQHEDYSNPRAVTWVCRACRTQKP